MKRIVVGVLAAAGLLAGCGPIESVAVIDDAQVALTGAKAANGDRYAPYEYTSAELYLDKAREERGHAEYQQAIGYARQAREMAREAESKSMKATQQQGDDASQGDLAPYQGSDAPASASAAPTTLSPDSESQTAPVKIVAPTPSRRGASQAHGHRPFPRSHLLAACSSSPAVSPAASSAPPPGWSRRPQARPEEGAMKCAPGSSPGARRTSPSPSASSTRALAAGPAGARPRPDLQCKAVLLSWGCIKQVLIKKPKPPPVIV